MLNLCSLLGTDETHQTRSRAGQLLHRKVGREVGRLVGREVGRLVGRLVERYIVT